MRMDIENSPGARGAAKGAAARDLDGHRLGDGRISGKRLCSIAIPRSFAGTRRRTFGERAMGVLWHHSSVNLVKPGPSHWPRRCLQRLPEIAKAVSIPATGRNRRSMTNKWRLQPQFRINHMR
jgi:hypothetical protein